MEYYIIIIKQILGNNSYLCLFIYTIIKKKIVVKLLEETLNDSHNKNNKLKQNKNSQIILY